MNAEERGGLERVISIVLYFIVFSLLVLAMSCCAGLTPAERAQKKYNKLERKQNQLKAEYPEIVEKRDTVTVTEVKIKPKEVVRFKPVRVIENRYDTIWQDNTRVVYRVQHDSIFLDVLSPPDTIFLTTNNITETVNTKPVLNRFQKFFKTIKDIFFILGIIFVILIILYFLMKIK